MINVQCFCLACGVTTHLHVEAPSKPCFHLGFVLLLMTLPAFCLLKKIQE